MSQPPFHRRPPGHRYPPHDPYAVPHAVPAAPHQPPELHTQPPLHGQPLEPHSRTPEQPGPGGGLPLPGLGVLLTIAGLAIQAVSLFLLPWISTGGAGPTISAVDLWEAAANFGAHGVGGWYLLLFSYPLAALSVVLTLAAIFESVAMKAVWAGLTLLGLGYLAVRHGVGPLVDKIGGDSADFTHADIVIGVVAVAAIVVVLFLLKTAVSMFRRVAVLILLVFAGLHLYAVADLTGASDIGELSFGAYGPSLGYLLCAVAVLLPKRLPGV